MKKTTIIILLNLSFLFSAFSQADENIGNQAVPNLASQVLAFPQEKLYVQTDRPYYVSGEKIFFRAFLLHASLNKPFYVSRYVYVELIDPSDEVVIRQQIRIEEDKMFYGVLTLPEDLPEGYYRIRSYTRYMENTGEESFYTRSVFIAHPNASKIEPEISVEFPDDKKAIIGLRFKNRLNGAVIRSGSIELKSPNDKKTAKLDKPDAEGWFYWKIDMKDSDAKRVLFVDYKDESFPFSKYVGIPYRNTHPEIGFYPEGGSLVAGQINRVAFKTLLPDGGAAGFEASVYDSKGELQTFFKTRHEGMGDFLLEAKAGESYYAQYIHENRTIKVNLPKVKTDACSLRAVWEEDGLSVSVWKGGDAFLSKAYLLIHNQGIPAYFEEWDFTENEKRLEKTSFKTGVAHLMLLDENLHPLSERLVFNNSNNHPKAEIRTDKERYAPRERISLDFDFHGMKPDTIPATFAVSVTDDKDVKLDTTTNILAEVLLVSELKGRIDNPAYYFSESKEVVQDADLLMLTHGWRNYHVDEALRGEIQLPKIRPESSQSLSGILKTPKGKPADFGLIRMKALGYDFSEGIEADEKGRYLFTDFELPDSTAIELYANNKNKRKKSDVEIHPDEIVYPTVSVSEYYANIIPKEELEEKDFIDYVSKSDKKYVLENGTRMIGLPELTVRGTRKKQKFIDNRSPIKEPVRGVSPGEIEETPLVSFEDIFARLGNPLGPFAFVVNGILRKTGNIDDLYDIYINLQDIAQLEYSNNKADIVFYTIEKDIRALILFTTWPAGYRGKATEKELYQTIVLPLGYQKPVEFYSPKYDTPEALNDPSPDLRSTIYWKPNGIVSGGNKASVDFYAADAKTSYSVIIEGVGNNRQLIHCRKEGLIKVE